uniref:Uncharacterized protein n=1 Tax=Panagrolaimus sp. PS1159 TaxID=55785 RepID=A0AC35GTV4_9BILA
MSVFLKISVLSLLFGTIISVSPTLRILTTPLVTSTTSTSTTLTSTLTTTTTSASTTTPHCGEWSEWSCTCCGGCPTRRCARSCQSTPGCLDPTCSGEGDKLDSTPCASPSETCKFPLPDCCDGQEAYVNFETVARWCRASSS